MVLLWRLRLLGHTAANHVGSSSHLQVTEQGLLHGAVDGPLRGHPLDVELEQVVELACQDAQTLGLIVLKCGVGC